MPYQMPQQPQFPHLIPVGGIGNQSFINTSMSIPSELIGEASGGHSTVFFGNISYDCDEIELDRTLRTAGPFRDMKLMYGDDNKPKGFGFYILVKSNFISYSIFFDLRII